MVDLIFSSKYWRQALPVDAPLNLFIIRKRDTCVSPVLTEGTYKEIKRGTGIWT